MLLSDPVGIDALRFTQLEFHYAEMDTTACQMRLIQAHMADVKRMLVDEELAVEREIRALEKDRTDLVCGTPQFGMLSMGIYYTTVVVVFYRRWRRAPRPPLLH